MATINAHQVVDARFGERTIGNWIADVQADTGGEALEGPVTIDVEGVEWSGTVFRGSAWGSRYIVRVVGGAGGLAKAVPVQWYDHGIEIRSLLAEILAIGGERLSDESDEAILSLQVPAYHRAGGTVAGALNDLLQAKAPQARWRFLRDGSVWVGVVAFPELEALETDVNTDSDPGDNRVEIAPDTPRVYPGVTYDGRCVSEVVTYVVGRRLRQELVCTTDDAPSKPFEEQLGDAVARRQRYRTIYSARVLSQSGSVVDVLLDDETMRGDGLTRVPLRHGMPGVTVELATGNKVLIGWENGDPSAPFAALWPDGSSVNSFTFAGDQHVTGEVTAQTGAGPGVTLSNHSHPSPFGPLGPPTVGT